MEEREAALGGQNPVGGDAVHRQPSGHGADDEESGQVGNGAKGSKKRGRKQLSFWKELPILVLVALVLALLIKTFLIQAFYIPSESMENTLIPGDRVLVNKLSYRMGDVKRGDVIVFNGADSWQSEITVPEPANPVQQGLRKVGDLFGFAPIGEKDFIKRVIGLPGDRVECCDAKGRIKVNGTPLAESNYLYPGDRPSNTSFTVEKVPEGRLWVMGDHRSQSADSRTHIGGPGGGTIPVDHVIGRAFVTVWPFDRITGLGRPESFEKLDESSASVHAPKPPARPAEPGIGVAAALPSAALAAGAAWRRRRT